MNKTAKFFITLALLGYILYLIISRTPAAWAVWAVHRAVPNIWLTGVSGTVWQGMARATQIDVAGVSIPIGEMRWQLSPTSLLKLKPCVKFEAELPRQMVSGRVCHGLDGQSKVSDMVLEAPVNLVKELLPIDVAGQASLQIIEARFKQNQVQKLDARLSWQDARVNPMDGWITLGTYAATIKEDGKGGLEAKIFDIDALFAVDFLAQWTAGAENWAVAGTVKPLEGAPKDVVEGLKVIGEDVGRGLYRLKWP